MLRGVAAPLALPELICFHVFSKSHLLHALVLYPAIKTSTVLSTVLIESYFDIHGSFFIFFSFLIICIITINE